MTALDAALRYRQRGFALLPLLPRSKQPHARVLSTVYGDPAWSSLRQRRASAAELHAWFDADPEANVGVITGRVSGGLVVADFDREADGVAHPPTPSVETARGWHIYLRAANPVPSRTHPWGELSGEGRYVVAPPSRHPSGHEYFFAISPDEVELADLDSLRIPGQPLSHTVDIGIDIHASDHDRGAEDGELARDPAAVSEALRVLGITSAIGRPFKCVLPGHDERKPSASIYLNSTGLHVYRDWHRRDGVEWLTLAEVRASRAAGRVLRLRAPSASRWYGRLFYDAGLLQPPHVELPRLPRSAPASVLQAARGFALLLGLRWMRDPPGSATPFVKTFMGPWCGFSESTAERAKLELLRRGVIEKVGEAQCGGRPTSLYLPGRGRSGGRR